MVTSRTSSKLRLMWYLLLLPKYKYGNIFKEIECFPYSKFTVAIIENYECEHMFELVPIRFV